MRKQYEIIFKIIQKLVFIVLAVTILGVLIFLSGLYVLENKEYKPINIKNTDKIERIEIFASDDWLENHLRYECIITDKHKITEFVDKSNSLKATKVYAKAAKHYLNSNIYVRIYYYNEKNFDFYKLNGEAVYLSESSSENMYRLSVNDSNNYIQYIFSLCKEHGNKDSSK